MGSGALEQIGSRVSSIVWLDAFKPEDGQKPIDFTNEGFRKAFLSSMEKGEPGFPVTPPRLSPIFVNEKDRDYVDLKLTPQPVGTQRGKREPNVQSKHCTKHRSRLALRGRRPSTFASVFRALAAAAGSMAVAAVDETRGGHCDCRKL